MPRNDLKYRYPRKREYPKKRVVSGGTMAPSTNAPKGAGVSAQKQITKNGVEERRTLPRIGRGKPSEIKKNFRKSFKKLDKPERHQLVQKVMSKKFGDTNWRKKVYGENYKAGTVKNLNKDIRKTRQRARSITAHIKGAKANLTEANDPTKRSKIETRLKELEAKQTGFRKEAKVDEKSRQKYLDLRNKSMDRIQVQSAKNPESLRRYREKLVTSKLEDTKKKKKKATSGGD